MIVPMKKVTLLALQSEKEKVLAALRDLGVMQIEMSGDISSDSSAAADKLALYKRVEGLMDQIAADRKLPPADSKIRADVEKLSGSVISMVDEKNTLTAMCSELTRKLDLLSVWGDFDRKLLDEMGGKGVKLFLCLGSEDDFISASERKDIVCCLINKARGKTAFAAAALDDIDENSLPLVKLADDDDPRELRDRISELHGKIADLDEKLAQAAECRGAVAAAVNETSGVLEFCRVMDSTANHGEVISLQGFVPAPQMHDISEAAKKNGWGFLAVDPGADDNVPVLLENKGIAKIIKPLFDFLDIIPGYRELDVSGAVMIFFTIFYAMIVGDAGYGLLFLGGTVVGMIACRNKPAAKTPLRLMMILSIATVVWGVLCGSYFGVTIGGLECLTAPGLKDRSIQFFCFLLAMAHLSVGRIWKAVRDRNWRSIGSNAGWMLIIWGNFLLTVMLLVKPEGFSPLNIMYSFYGSGLLLVILCGVNWKDPAEIFQFPFSIIGSFTDVLSYIRLFAVGMSGACIASSFNGIGTDVIKNNPWLFLLGVIVIVFGHLLNIALAMMGVLVHAVRLNTLEFSNHTGLTWSGQKFNPFKNNNKEEGNR